MFGPRFEHVNRRPPIRILVQKSENKLNLKTIALAIVTVPRLIARFAVTELNGKEAGQRTVPSGTTSSPKSPKYQRAIWIVSEGVRAIVPGRRYDKHLTSPWSVLPAPDQLSQESQSARPGAAAVETPCLCRVFAPKREESLERRDNKLERSEAFSGRVESTEVDEIGGRGGQRDGAGVGGGVRGR